MKKVLGLVISRRKLGNSELLLKEIMSNIPQECSLELIRLTDLKLESCNACYRCLDPDQECPIEDDFNFVMGKIKEADALILGVPVYILGPHGVYKMLIDRLVGSENYAASTQGKPCILVIPYGARGWEGYAKAAALTLPRFLKMQLVDCWQIHATLPGESLFDADNAAYARNLGVRLFQGKAYQPGVRECPTCGSDLFRLLPGNKVECPICGIQGVLNSDNLPDFTAAGYCRFGNKEMEEHFKVWLVEMKHRFAVERKAIKAVQSGYRDKDWWIRPGK